jgi:hypothetical protein
MDRSVVCTELVAHGRSHGQQRARFAMALAMETHERLDSSCALARGGEKDAGSRREGGGRNARLSLSLSFSRDRQKER